MSKIKRIPEKEKETEVVDYEKLRVDVLKSLADGRNIDCKQNKEEIIKHLKLDDEGKYVRSVTYEKQPDGTFIVGIALNDSKNLIDMGQFVLKGIAKNMQMYTNDRLHYISKQKLI
mgnify:FL=1|jgi:cytoplasmic iron level regulating protein YaaA (DUF328/UPF0246 family)